MKRLSEYSRTGLFLTNTDTSLFPPSLFDELDALAIKTGVSKSEMIREATMEYVNRHMAEEGE